MNVDIALDCQCELGEGPIWDHRIGRLLFVDINGHRVHTFDPAAGAHETADCGEYVSAIVLAPRGGYLVTLQHDIAWFDGARVGERPLTAESGRRTRFNDGYVDPRGRFWAGTMSLDRKPGQGALYRVDMNPSPWITRVLEHVTTSNGIDWSDDGRLMYYVDTGTRALDVFDFDVERAAISNRRTLVSFPEPGGKPDGLVLDADGAIWVALYQGGRVQQYSPDGTLLQEIALPVSCPTKCAFGGANLDELYITTARAALSDQERATQPHAGSLFVAQPGASGRPAREFGASASVR